MYINNLNNTLHEDVNVSIKELLADVIKSLLRDEVVSLICFFLRVVFASLCYNLTLFWHNRILCALATHTVAVTALRPPPAYISADNLDRAVGALTLLLDLCSDKDNASRTFPFSQPLQHDSHSQNTLSQTTPVSSNSSSATPSTPVPTSLLGKRPGPATSHVGSNKKTPKPPPPPPPVRALQGSTLKIRGMTPAKRLSILGLSVFPSLDYIILTEHQMSAEFRPDKIIKSGWDFHAVSGTVTTLPQRG